MAKKRLWPKVGRWISGLVVLCFFLPFFGVSCEAEGTKMDVISISGTDMVGGCRPGGLLGDASKDDVKGGELKVDNVDREVFAVLALAFAFAAFALAWVRTRFALVATFVVALAGLGSLAGLYVKITGQLDDAVAEQSKKSHETKFDKDVKVSAGSRFGFWVVAIGLLGVVVLTGRELGHREPTQPDAGVA